MQNQNSYVLKTWYAAQETQALQSLTLIYLQVMSDLVAYTLKWEESHLMGKHCNREKMFEIMAIYM